MRASLRPGGRFDWVIPLIVCGTVAAFVFVLGMAFAYRYMVPPQLRSMAAGSEASEPDPSEGLGNTFKC
jgi:hypothetical protein